MFSFTECPWDLIPGCGPIGGTVVTEIKENA
jgi:hypothetical protein